MEQRARGGAPWWLVVVLVVVLVVGVVLTLGAVGGDRTATSGPTRAVESSSARPSATGSRDTTPVELPARAAGLRIPDDDPTGLDRERTRTELSDAADGVGADVATYVDDAGRPLATVTAARMDSLPLFTVRRPPEEVADVVVEVRQVGDARCQVAGTDGQESVVQCLLSEPGLSVSVVPLGEATSDLALVARLTDEVATALS